jgi:hypothetical protein
MHIATENHGNMSCEIRFNKKENNHTGILKYNNFEAGLICNSSADAVRTQFHTICKMIDKGGMLRHGVILLGYHNGDFGGDVLRVDGEVIGEWASDDEEWCHFTAVDADEVTRSAPSHWMLHDSIAKWTKCGDEKCES